MTPARPLNTLRRRALAAGLLCLLGAQTDARAQSRWRVDPQASLAWWQMSPHLNHLWATTCPQDMSWRPGEGRSGGRSTTSRTNPSEHGYAAVPETVHVPLYPRFEVQSVCTEAVAGEFVVADTAAWRGIRGEVAVRADALVTGDRRRDEFAHESVLHSSRYSHIRFTLDSLVDLTRQADTLRGTAWGVFSLHGASEPVSASVSAWPEAGGTRALAKFSVPAHWLVSKFGLSKYALGLGIGLRLWRDLFMGVDLLLREEAPD